MSARSHGAASFQDISTLWRGSDRVDVLEHVTSTCRSSVACVVGVGLRQAPLLTGGGSRTSVGAHALGRPRVKMGPISTSGLEFSSRGYSPGYCAPERRDGLRDAWQAKAEGFEHGRRVPAKWDCPIRHGIQPASGGRPARRESPGACDAAAVCDGRAVRGSSMRSGIKLQRRSRRC